MIDIQYEHHLMPNPDLPFIFHTDFYMRRESGVANWHENTEFLYCIQGKGNVNCDTSDIGMKKGDTVIINARQLHTVSSEAEVKYRCLIIDNSFFRDNGIDIENLSFAQSICDEKAGILMERIALLFTGEKTAFSVAETRLAVLDYISSNVSAFNCGLACCKCFTGNSQYSVKFYGIAFSSVELLDEKNVALLNLVLLSACNYNCVHEKHLSFIMSR